MTRMTWRKEEEEEEEEEDFKHYFVKTAFLKHCFVKIEEKSDDKTKKTR